jgi:hypothetical protein
MCTECVLLTQLWSLVTQRTVQLAMQWVDSVTKLVWEFVLFKPWIGMQPPYWERVVGFATQWTVWKLCNMWTRSDKIYLGDFCVLKLELTMQHNESVLLFLCDACSGMVCVWKSKYIAKNYWVVIGILRQRLLLNVCVPEFACVCKREREGGVYLFVCLRKGERFTWSFHM